MANKNKPGIKYFSQDSDHVLNKKVKLLFNEFDANGPWVWECLKCEIYGKKGYYFDISDTDELMLFASDVCKKQVSLVKEIINGCVRRGLFDETVFNVFKVLTSDRIQNNYLDGTREPRKKGYGIELINEYMLIDIGQNERAITIIRLNDAFSRENEEKSREKLDKVDKSKVEEIRAEKVYTRDEIFENEVIKFFGFNILGNYHRQQKMLEECCAALFFSDMLDHFKNQFFFFKKLRSAGNQKYKGSFENFLGKQEKKFEDGNWNKENWELRFEEEKEVGGRKSEAAAEESKVNSARQRHEESLKKFAQNGNKT